MGATGTTGDAIGDAIGGGVYEYGVVVVGLDEANHDGFFHSEKLNHPPPFCLHDFFTIYIII
jgi:hypothetical protein